MRAETRQRGKRRHQVSRVAQTGRGHKALGTPVESDPQGVKAKDQPTVARRSQAERRVSPDRCRRCRGPICGRRRNGYCSDRCRMQARRAQRQERRLEVCRAFDEVTAAVRRELLGEEG